MTSGLRPLTPASILTSHSLPLTSPSPLPRTRDAPGPAQLIPPPPPTSRSVENLPLQSPLSHGGTGSRPLRIATGASLGAFVWPAALFLPLPSPGSLLRPHLGTTRTMRQKLPALCRILYGVMAQRAAPTPGRRFSGKTLWGKPRPLPLRPRESGRVKGLCLLLWDSPAREGIHFVQKYASVFASHLRNVVLEASGGGSERPANIWYHPPKPRRLIM